MPLILAEEEVDFLIGNLLSPRHWNGCQWASEDDVRAYSSTAEQGTHNPLVPGSNPGGPNQRKVNAERTIALPARCRAVRLAEVGNPVTYRICRFLELRRLCANLIAERPPFADTSRPSR